MSFSSFADIKTEVKLFMVEPIFILRVYRVLRHIVGFCPDFRFFAVPFIWGLVATSEKFFAIWRYNGGMARPTKFNEETSERLLNFISAGFTVTQACKGVNISTDTCSRWRQKDLDFNKRFIEATKSQQWGSAAALAKYGCRTYKRKVRISPDYGPALSQSPAGASQSPFNLEGDKTPTSNKPTHYRGFPIRYGNLADDKPFEVCAVARTPEYLAWCEREKGTGRIIEHHCSIDAHLRWLKKQRKQNLYSDDNDLVFGWVF